MSNKAIKGNETLAKQIRLRRCELGLTIEKAASLAGVGTKTWCRYEAGESIRKDKCKGVCKALNWLNFPDQDIETDKSISVLEYKNHPAWSKFLEEEFGSTAALSFAIGSDILYDHIIEDLTELSSLPLGTHIGQLDISWLSDCLPEQFLMHYDYEFLYQMECCLYRMRVYAKNNVPMTAHSVLEELLLYLCAQEASALIELSDGFSENESIDNSYLEEWVFDLFDDMDIITFLYSKMYLKSDHSYHFSHWTDQQFFMDRF